MRHVAGRGGEDGGVGRSPVTVIEGEEAWPIPQREAKSKRLGSATVRIEVAESVP